MSILEYDDLTEMITTYLNAHEMGKVADAINQEIKSNHPPYLVKYVQKKQKAFIKGIEQPRLITLKKNQYNLNRREVNLER